MSDTQAQRRATREAVQPSLWDRLINDLPGLNAEISHLRDHLERELGAERVENYLIGGPKSIEVDAELSQAHKKDLHRLIFQNRRRDMLEDRGIVVSSDVLREAVRRDIEALFNTERFEITPFLTDAEREYLPDTPPSLDDFPEVRRSVVNYGVPAFAGHNSRDFDREELAKEIKEILAVFEPRLKKSSLKVTVKNDSKKGGVYVEIDGMLIMSPAPERLRLRTLIDLDNGRALTEAEDS